MRRKLQKPQPAFEERSKIFDGKRSRLWVRNGGRLKLSFYCEVTIKIGAKICENNKNAITTHFVSINFQSIDVDVLNARVSEKVLSDGKDNEGEL